MTDRRSTPANARVAHVSLRGLSAAPRLVEGEAGAVVAPLADLLAEPGGARERQLLRGDPVLVLDRHAGFAFLRSEKDGYCGYVEERLLGPAIRPTHRVAVPATHLYPAPDLRRREIARLSFGARLVVTGEAGRFARTDDGLFVPACHLEPAGRPEQDPAAVAELFRGTPYLWGGNSRDGLDCSGLVQAALLACGIACPGDSDQQARMVGEPLAGLSDLRRGDLVFWKGHVAMALSPDRIIHANAHSMSVACEALNDAVARIAATEGPVIALRRPRP
ncbi:MAG: C40 family peptidase [Rhodobacteraceae bacterium]|nr:C40 family peptidase [Paracoccaceae bacterium]